MPQHSQPINLARTGHSTPTSTEQRTNAQQFSAEFLKIDSSIQYYYSYEQKDDVKPHDVLFTKPSTDILSIYNLLLLAF